MLRVKSEHIGTVLSSGRGSTVLKQDTPQEILKKLADNPKKAYLVEKIEEKLKTTIKHESGKGKTKADAVATDSDGVLPSGSGQ